MLARLESLDRRENPGLASQCTCSYRDKQLCSVENSIEIKVGKSYP